MNLICDTHDFPFSQIQIDCEKDIIFLKYTYKFTFNRVW